MSTNKIEERVKPCVLMVHGIHSEGRWQDPIAQVLKWFYEPVPIRYNGFRNFGALLVVCEPLVAILGLIVLATSLWSDTVSWVGVAVAMTLIFLSMTSPALAFRRRAAMRAYRLEVGNRFLGRPHVIAHSFGTYLTARLLSEHPSARINGLVLVGCILPTTFDWADLLGRKVRDVRNDFSRMDFVARLAGLGRWLGYGGSGAYGFFSHRHHNVDDPDSVCPHAGPCEGVLHNVDCSGTWHTDSVATQMHVSRYWLPFFWKIDTGEYSKLLDLCANMFAAYLHADDGQIANCEISAKTLAPRWLGGATLWEWLRDMLRSKRLSHDEEDVGLLLMQFCVRMQEGVLSRFQNSLARNMHPHIAVKEALENWKASS